MLIDRLRLSLQEDSFVRSFRRIGLLLAGLGYLGVFYLHLQCRGLGIEENALRLMDTPSHLQRFHSRHTHYLSLLQDQSEEVQREVLHQQMARLGLSSHQQHYSAHNGPAVNYIFTFHPKITHFQDCDLVTFPLLKESMVSALLLAQSLSQKSQNFISRPIVFLFYQDSLRAYGQPGLAYLEEYFHRKVNMSHPLPTYGIIRHALHLHIPSASFSSLRVSYDCLNGKVPDLDFLRIMQQYVLRSPFKLFLNRSASALMKQVHKEVFRWLPGVSGLSLHLANQLVSSMWPSRQHLHPAFFREGINSVSVSAVASAPLQDSVFQLHRLLRDLLRSLSALDENLHAAPTFYWACNNSGSFVTISNHFWPILTALISLFLYSFLLYKKNTQPESLGLSLFLSCQGWLIGAVSLANVYLVHLLWPQHYSLSLQQPDPALAQSFWTLCKCSLLGVLVWSNHLKKSLFGKEEYDQVTLLCYNVMACNITMAFWCFAYLPFCLLLLLPLFPLLFLLCLFPRQRLPRVLRPALPLLVLLLLSLPAPQGLGLALKEHWVLGHNLLSFLCLGVVPCLWMGLQLSCGAWC